MPTKIIIPARINAFIQAWLLALKTVLPFYTHVTLSISVENFPAAAGLFKLFSADASVKFRHTTSNTITFS
jgi:hypothetical protein